MLKSLIRSFSLLVLFFGIFVDIQARVAARSVIFPSRDMLKKSLNKLGIHSFLRTKVLRLVGKELSPDQVLYNLRRIQADFVDQVKKSYNDDHDKVEQYLDESGQKNVELLKILFSADREAERELKIDIFLEANTIVKFPPQVVLDEICKEHEIFLFMTKEEFLEIVKSEITILALSSKIVGILNRTFNGHSDREFFEPYINQRSFEIFNSLIKCDAVAQRNFKTLMQDCSHLL